MATQAPTPQDRPVTQSLNCGSHDHTANSLATQNGYSTTNETLNTRSQKSNGFTHPSETKPNGYSSPPAKNMDDLSTYDFPVGKLSTFMHDPSKTPLLLVACGSFSPITYLHLRMFEMVADYVRFKTDFEIVGGYLSPVSDAYKKKGLASAKDRIRMCEIGAMPSDWLMIDPWEAIQKEYTRTALVLDHFDYEINVVRDGIALYEPGNENEAREHGNRGVDGNQNLRKPVRVALLAGADLIGTMSTPGVWSAKDLDHILGRYGAFIVERTGTDIDKALADLKQWKNNIYVIPQQIQNDVSSTKIRQFLAQYMSVHYLIPDPVIRYIEQHGLYEDNDAAASSQRKKRHGRNKPSLSASDSDSNLSQS